MIVTAVAALAAAIWLCLALAHGRFWTTSVRLPAAPDPRRWPAVVAVVPARDEAAVLPESLPSLVNQRYAGSLRVVVVDDDSSDGTGDLARAFGAQVIESGGPPDGWSGKVAAMAAGVRAAGAPDYLLFTDADIAHPPDSVARLVRAAQARQLVLTSQMARLRVASPWERLLVPAFVWFFGQLYPFSRVNGPGRTAAAAGGCMLVDRQALAEAGGLAAIRDAVIDDVALARVLKRHGPIWLGLSADIRSIRPYPRLADVWNMVARSAYTQLRYSPVLLAGTVLGLLVTYVMPLVATVVAASAGNLPALVLAAGAELVMAATYVPILRFYRVTPWSAFALPAVALLYAAMTVDSARRHRVGQGAAWKGRVQGVR